MSALNGQTFIHYKNGHLYAFLGFSVHEDGTLMVGYQRLTGNREPHPEYPLPFTRPASEFFGLVEVLKPVPHHPEQQSLVLVPRFKLHLPPKASP